MVRPGKVPPASRASTLHPVAVARWVARRMSVRAGRSSAISRSERSPPVPPHRGFRPAWRGDLPCARQQDRLAGFRVPSGAMVPELAARRARRSPSFASAAKSRRRASASSGTRSSNQTRRSGSEPPREVLRQGPGDVPPHGVDGGVVPNPFAHLGGGAVEVVGDADREPRDLVEGQDVVAELVRLLAGQHLIGLHRPRNRLDPGGWTMGRPAWAKPR